MPLSAAALDIPDAAALDAILDGYVAEGAAPFLYARLERRDGSVLYEHSAANRELLGDVRIDGQSWMRIWSMSKIVTIAVVMDLVEEDLLSLDDPVLEFVPEFDALQVAVTEAGRQISALEDPAAACPFQLTPVSAPMTVAHLIHHQAGFYYATNNIPCIDEPLKEANVATAEDTDDFLARLATLPLVQQPGAGDHYGTNTTVLGMVAERATGRSLAQLVEERLTTPLEIAGLRYGLPDGATLLPTISGADGTLRPARAGELDIFGSDVPDYDPARTLYLGGEGMLATADGYADFLRMLLDGGALNGVRVLDAETVALMHAPHTQLDNPEGHNGFNLWITGQPMRDRGEGEAGLWLGGGYEGTHFWVDPRREFVAVVMSQVFAPPLAGTGHNAAFRGALYKQFWEQEAN